MVAHILTLGGNDNFLEHADIVDISKFAESLKRIE